MTNPHSYNAVRIIDCTVTEVLPGCGLATLSAPSGLLYSVDRSTKGIKFDSLSDGQLLRCEIALPYGRIVSACPVGPTHGGRNDDSCTKAA